MARRNEMEKFRRFFAVFTMVTLLIGLAGTLWAGDVEKIDINTATVKELMQLNQIGEVKAKAIVAYREKNGAFKTPADFTNVSGIGPKIFAANKDRIIVGKAIGEAAKSKVSEKAAKTSSKATDKAAKTIATPLKKEDAKKQ